MADPKILYNNLFSDKLYTKSYDDFVKQFEEEGAAQKLYNNLQQDGLYTQDFDSFKAQFKLGKQNGPVQENTAIAGSVNTSSTDSTLDPGSLDLPKIPKPIGSELDNLTIDDIKKQDQNKKQKEDFKKNNKKELDISDLIDENGKIKLSRKTIYALGSGTIEDQISALEEITTLTGNKANFAELPYLREILKSKKMHGQRDKTINEDGSVTINESPMDNVGAFMEYFGLLSEKFDFGNNDNSIYTEPIPRTDSSGQYAITSAVLGLGGAKPYIFSKENKAKMNLMPGQTPTVMTYGEQDYDAITDYGATPFNPHKLQNIYFNNIADSEYDSDLLNYKTPKEYGDWVFDKGSEFHTAAEKKILELKNKYDLSDPEQVKKLKGTAEYDAFLKNLPDQLYEVSGPNKGSIISLDKASTDAIEIQERSQELLETTEFDDLKIGLARAYSRLKGISKDIYGVIQEQGEDNFQDRSLSPYKKHLGKVFDFFGGEQNINADLRNLKSIVDNNTIPKNISILPGDTPEANAFNEALKEYLALNKAVTLNIDPITQDRGNIFTGVFDNLGRRVNANQKVTKEEAVQYFDQALKRNTNLVYIDPKKANERLYEGFGNARYFGDGFIDLAAFGLEIYATRKASGNIVKKSFGKLDKILKPTKAYNNRITRNAIRIGMGAVDEAALFVGSQAIKGATMEEQKSTIPFALSLGGSGVFASKLTNLIGRGKYFTAAGQKLNNYYATRFLSQGTISAGTGSSVYHFSQFLTENDEFQKLLTIDKNDPSYSDFYGEKLMESWLAEFGKMFALNSMKHVGKFNNTLEAMKTDIRNMQGRNLTSERAATYFGVEYKKVDDLSFTEKNLEKKYVNKLNEINKKLKNKEITEEEHEKEVNALELNKLAIENRQALIIYKNGIKAGEGKNTEKHYLENEGEANRIGQKLYRGEELTENESRKFNNSDPAYVLNSMGVIGRKLMQDRLYKENVLLQKEKHERIQFLLDGMDKRFGGMFKVAYNAKEMRDKAYDHLTKTWNTETKLTQLEIKGEKTESDKAEIKKLNEELTSLREGEAFKNIQFELKKYTEERYQEDIAGAKEILKATGQAKGLKQARSEKEFQDIYDASGLKSANVKGTLAFYNPRTQKMVINKEHALKTRTITSAKHEVLHHVLRDVLKVIDKNGNSIVTKEGIKIIDEVLENLDKNQRELIQKRIDESYRFDENGKELAKNRYYEEYLTILSEEISNGRIAFKDNIGNSLLNFIPGMRKKGFENLEIGVETGEQLFNLIKSYSKNETLGIEAAKAISKDAPVKGLKGEGKASKDFKIELESDKKTGVAKLKAKIQENRDMGPSNQILNKRIEQEFKDQIKRVEDLETQFTATDLRAKIKKAKGQNKEDLQLALQEKFRGFEKEVELAELNIETGEARFSKNVKGNINELARDMAKKGFDNLTGKELKAIKDQYTNVALAAIKFDVGKGTVKQQDAVSFVNEAFTTIARNYRVRNPKTNKKIDFTTYIYNTIGRRGAALYGKQEGLTEAGKTTSIDDVRVKELADQKQNIEDAIDVSFGNKSEVSKISNGTPSIVQRNLKVNGKKILSEEDGPALRGEFIDAAIRISEKLIKDLKLPPDSKKFRKQLGKEIAKETELFEEFKNKIGEENYDTFLSTVLPGIIKNPKGLPLSFYVQGEKFSQKLGREPLFVVKEADANPKSKYLKKAGPGYTSENPAAQNYSKATTKPMIELAIKEGKASYTENTANGVFVYNRLDTRKESPNKIKEFFKVQNTKEKFIRTLFNQAMIDAVIGQRKKNLYSVTEKAKIAEKAQKEHDVFFSKNKTAATEKAKGKREEGMGPKGFYIDGPAQNKAHTNLIKKAIKLAKEGKIDKAFLEIIISITNTAPTGGQVNKATPDVFEGKKRSSKDPKKITQKLLTGDYRVSREDLSGVAGSGYTLTLLEAGYLWNVEKLGNIVKEAFGKQEFTDAVKHGKSSQGRGNTKTMEALSKKNFTKEELTKEVIDWYVENAIKLHKIDSRAAWDLLYNQNASGGINRQLSKVILHELGTKKVDTRLEHLLQNGAFNTLIQDMSKMSEAGKNQVKEWIKKSYRQAAISETTRKIVDGTYIVEGREKRWEAAYELPPIIQDAINRIKKGEKNVEIPSIDARLFNRAYGNNTVNPYAIKTFDKNGKIISKAEEYGLYVPSRVWRNSVTVQKNAANIIADIIAGKITRAEGIERFNKTLPISIQQSRVALKFSKGRTSDIVEVINQKENKNKEIREKQTALFSKQDISKQFNNFLEKSTGIKKESVFGAATAMARGKQAKTDFGDYFIPVGAEDFAGLMHKTLAKGKQGEKQLEFYDKVLYEPYNKAVQAMTTEAMGLKNDFKALKKQLNNVPKTLKQFTKGGFFTKEQAVRVYMWNKLGYEIPGISKKNKSELLKEVEKDADLHTFANEIIKITKGDGYAKPKESWVAGNIAMDMVDLLNTTKRTKHLETWQKNVDQIFSKENLFKLEAAYGAKYVKTLKGTLARMKSGSNRKWGANETVEKWNDWINGSVGAIMFLNTRSAVLQTISNINYINFTDNNPLQAAKAFANQKQYWTDFNTLFNSEYLQSRRGGNRINVNESELALAQQKGGVQGVIALMLNKGFVLTRMADSFAIATGGASMYRNRLNRYKKEGLSEKVAQERAFRDFMKITEETQQSSRPDRISEQQASNLGRFMLAFANTPMQYNRIIKRNLQDLIAGRGDPREKMTKITYYGMIQNIIFNALSKALFVSAFSDEEEDAQQERTVKVAEGMLDTLLRGSGLYGNAAVAVKNTAKAIATDRQDPELQALTISPPLYSKVSKLRNAFYTRKYITKKNMFEPSLDNPALNAGAQFSSAVFNFPLDRAIRKAQNVEAAMSEGPEYWQRVALSLGWAEWELGLDEEEQKTMTINPRKQTKRKSVKRKSTKRKR